MQQPQPASSPEWLDWMRGLVKVPDENLTVQQIANRVYEQRARSWTNIVVVLLFIAVAMYVKAMYNQQDVIHVFEQNIDSSIPSIQMQAYMLGSLINPQRIALVCEYPMLTWWLGYTSPYTGPVISALAKLEPSVERVVMALTLLESGLVVNPDGKTVPPTIFQEVLRQVYPADTWHPPPPVLKPPSFQKKTVSMFNQVLPWIMQLGMFAAMA